MTPPSNAHAGSNLSLVRPEAPPEPETALEIGATPEPDASGALTVPPDLPPPLRRFAEELRDAVETALRAKDSLLVERERELRDVSVALARAETTAQAQAQTFAEMRRRLESSNQQLAQAIDERDRKLVVFSRKLDQTRVSARDAEARRRAERERRQALLAELEDLSWWSRARRREIVRELAAL